MEEWGLTFDDILLIPRATEILPRDVDIKTRLTNTIRLNIPIVSAAMDTVTESATAISMAQEGGIGIIHRNLPVRGQAHEVDKVKKSESGMIVDPITIEPDRKIGEALAIMEKYRISGVPVVKGNRLMGILTNRDLRFEENLELPVQEVMTKHNLVTVSPGISMEESKKILHEHRIEKLLVVDDQFNLKGLITIKDIQKTKKYPCAAKDGMGRLLVGAAVGVGIDREERIQALLDVRVDVIVVDTAHGHSKMVMDAVRDTKRNFKNLPLIAGNVATSDGCAALIAAGADAVKVGMGPGSICTTRIVAGVGMPQFTAIRECSKIAKKKGIPLIADGGIKFSGDVTKAMAAGADTVMIGSLFAGTDESPGDMILFQGRSYKTYRGMGSMESLRKGSRDRYGQEDIIEEAKLVPEGIEGRVPYKGPLSNSIYQLTGGLKAGMGYLGTSSIQELQGNIPFVRITPAGLRESHVHDVIITQEAPNYRLE
ncbi:MAG: IMP dehydrogenase [Deltaproteobacteria bacterium]|nr:IMP dehydrogenase [Candidatus Zymogenaceae bacterium]